MHDAVTRSTFAYATFLFVVLFGPQVVLPHHEATGAFVSVLPGVFSFLGMLVILYVAVRHAMAGRAEATFARGFARGAAVSCMGALLYAIGIAVGGAAADSDPLLFRSATVAGCAVFVAVLGTGASALFAYLAVQGGARNSRPA
jgi:hypothetical protein